MSRHDDDSLKAFLVLFIFAVIVAAVYFFFKMLVSVGFVLVIIGALGLVIGLLIQDSRIAVIGLVILIIGGGMCYVGGEGVRFFEINPIGKAAHDTSTAVLNTTKEGIQQYSEMEKLKNNATKNALRQLS